MSVTHSVNVVYTPEGGTPVQYLSSQESGAAISLDEDIDASQTDKLVAFVLDVSQAKMIIIVADGGDMTVETNSSSAPAETLSLIDGVPILWDSRTGMTNPFGSTDVTALYITNVDAATLRIRVLYDPTV
jgi:hypothetical protein